MLSRLWIFLWKSARPVTRERAWAEASHGVAREEIQALETTEKVIATLALSAERDAVIDRLMAAIEQDRAELLASIVGGQALHREPQRLRKQIGGG